jgi:hypothetical protein
VVLRIGEMGCHTIELFRYIKSFIYTAASLRVRGKYAALMTKQFFLRHVERDTSRGKCDTSRGMYDTCLSVVHRGERRRTSRDLFPRQPDLIASPFDSLYSAFQ